MSILARTAIRQAAVAGITAIAGITVDSPGDWAVETDRMPNIKLRCTSERKQSNAKSVPNFTTMVTIELIASLQALTDAAAQDAIEALGFSIENALFTYQPLITLLSQIQSVSTDTEITAQGEQHIARIRMSVDCETFEVFDPALINPGNYPAFSEVVINADTASPFDPGQGVAFTYFDVTGSVAAALAVVTPGSAEVYPDPPFPASVVPAPRTTGPDGRNEGTLQIILPSA